ncbi:MAG: cell division protein FtsZ [Rikenellaceae bacterium]
MSKKFVKNSGVSANVVQSAQVAKSNSIITVVGVGGAGGNAVNYMCQAGVKDVEFMVCNTDDQALKISPAKNKLRIGKTGLGAGNNPSKGREAAQQSMDEIRREFTRLNTKMVFFTAGMGGGTGTGATPIIAEVARDMGILSVAVVTVPLMSEGLPRRKNALDGIKKLRKNVDSLLVIHNDNISKLYKGVSLSQAFVKTDMVLHNAVKGIAEIITEENNLVNVDFSDIDTALRGSGRAHLGFGSGSGKGGVLEATKMALASTLLDRDGIAGASEILLHITAKDIHYVDPEELVDVLEYLQKKANALDNEGNELSANVVWGYGAREELESDGDCEVVLVAAKFSNDYLSDDDLEIASSGASFAKTISTIKERTKASAAKGEEVILPERDVRFPNIETVVMNPAYRAAKLELISDDQLNDMIEERRNQGDK